MAAYYNEIDPFAAEWLRHLIQKGLIAKGDVDNRSITEVKPDDIKNYTQCHFFAGIGGWSYALRQAGWPDDLPVWTGSCPCQPFSVAGNKKGFKDERHLFPSWFNLIRECKPLTIFGEQVSSKDALSWFDDVQNNLENENYAVGALDTCAAGIGAPHIRQRLYWVADARREHERPIVTGFSDGVKSNKTEGIGSATRNESTNSCKTNDMAHTDSKGFQGYKQESRNETEKRREGTVRQTGRGGDVDDLAYSKRNGLYEDENGRGTSICQKERWMLESKRCYSRSAIQQISNATNGFWGGCDWILCRDGKFRAIKPGISALADGVSARVGRLRGYGNAIVTEQAKTFIECFMELM